MGRESANRAQALGSGRESSSRQSGEPFRHDGRGQVIPRDIDARRSLLAEQLVIREPAPSRMLA